MHSSVLNLKDLGKKMHKISRGQKTIGIRVERNDAEIRRVIEAFLEGLALKGSMHLGTIR